MAEDAKNRDTKKKTSPSIELGWDPLVLAPDSTYSTTIRVTLRGWWEGGRPRTGSLSFAESGAVQLEVELRFREPQVLYPKTGLQAGHHYEIKVVIGSESASKLMVVPTPPKPKSADEVALERKLFKLRLKQAGRDLAKTEHELTEIGKRPERPPKTLSVERIGRKPNLRFSISLTAADGRGAAGVVEAICLGYGAERVDVDESGSAIWPSTPIDFPEKMRRYRFRIAGTDIADKNATRECVAF